ncbi:hypothetical protein ABNF65_15225 [Paenibacillus larvae]
MNLAIFLLVSLGIYVVARADVQYQTKEKGFVSQHSQTLLSYYMSSSYKMPFPIYLAITVFLCQIAMYLTYLYIKNWSISIMVFYIAFKVITQHVKRSSYKMKKRINEIAPNIIESLSTSYSVNTGDITKSFRSTVSELKNKTIREPMLRFIDGVIEGRNPVELSNTAKLHFRNPLMHDLIDAVTEEKTNGGMFSQRINQLQEEARRLNEVETELKTATMDSVIASYFITSLVMIFYIGFAIWKPDMFRQFTDSSMGNTFIVTTLLFVVYNLTISDAKTQLKER